MPWRFDGLDSRNGLCRFLLVFEMVLSFLVYSFLCGRLGDMLCSLISLKCFCYLITIAGLRFCLMAQV